jgi:hypothetical protein
MAAKRTYDRAVASGAPATEEPTYKWWNVLRWYSDFVKKAAPKLVFII